jgi:hypothetical protein
MFKLLSIAAALAAVSLLGSCQDCQDNPLALVQKHVEYLADDELEGRQTGSEGERLAYTYIIEQFKSMGLRPAGDDSENAYLQAFEFFSDKKPGEDLSLDLLGMNLEAETDFYPLALSGEGSGSRALRYVGYGLKDYTNAWWADQDLSGSAALVDLSIPGGANPHDDFYAQIDARTKAQFLKGLGFECVVFYTEDPHVDVPSKNWNRKVSELEGISVFWLTAEGLGKLKSGSNGLDFYAGLGDYGNLDFNLSWDKHFRTGHNVLAKLDRGADHTIIIGGHYDHLGMGHFGSLHGGEPEVHNGADDNASGIAGLIEIARQLKNSGADKNNYLFMAFSGEEWGLYGSKHFTQSDAFADYQFNYMINLDMVGRLDSTTRDLIADGASSSPAFAVLDSLDVADLSIKAGGSGLGSSDHMSFYLEDIPAIHLFTGTHGDYHKPSDDAHLVNYQGILDVSSYAVAVIEELDDDGKLEFVEVAEESEPVPDFKVTLGVIPDYMFEGQGMRIESIRDGRAAALAGLQDGDVVIALGDHEVADMQSYMKGLSLFNKGEQTRVKVIRGAETLEMDLTW